MQLTYYSVIVMSSTAKKCWNDECSFNFPQFQKLFPYENEKPSTLFIELLLVAFIDDWESVTEFEKIMSELSLDSVVNFKNRLTTLFSKNSAAFSYLSMGFNFMCKEKGDLGSEFLLEVDPACIREFEVQKKKNDELSVIDFVTSRVDAGAASKNIYKLCLRALSLFRKDRATQYHAITKADVFSFLSSVFANPKIEPEKNKQGNYEFFEAINKYETADAEPSKDQAFIERTSRIIEDLFADLGNLIEFKFFVHQIPIFVEFAKFYRSSPRKH